MENAGEQFVSPGDRNIEQRAYMEPMNESLRTEAIDTCSRFNESVPESVVMGGMALRFQYEAKTGQKMFGTGKGDYDFYVPMDIIQQLGDMPPEGYRAKAPEEFMQPGKPLEPHHRALEDRQNRAHIDLFGTPDERRSEQMTIDGKTVRALTVDELVVDQAGILARDLTRNGQVEDRRKFYAVKLREIVAKTPDTAAIDEAWQRETSRMETAIKGSISRLKSDAGSSFGEKAIQSLNDAIAQGDKNAQVILEAVKGLDVSTSSFPQQFENVVLDQRLAQYRRGWRDLVESPTSISQEPEKETSSEARNIAESTIMKSLGREREELGNFDEQLKSAAKELPRYREITERLSAVEQAEVPYELFKTLRRSTDTASLDPDAPKDGVLVKSMERGQLECAGRAMIASTYLQERGVPHVAAHAPGHAFLVIDQSPDTLAYFDANNNLYFTFPKSALEGYQGADTITECRLKEFVPRDSDVRDGINTVFSHFIAIPAQEGMGRQYLGNVAAALLGRDEFEQSGIETNPEAATAVRQIETSLYGSNKTLEYFQAQEEGLVYDEDQKTAADRQIIQEYVQKHPGKENFVSSFEPELLSKIIDRIPYLKHAPEAQKQEYARQLWDTVQAKGAEEARRGR